MTLLKWLALAGCLVWLFYPGLIDSQVPAFRDAYHFYYPQAVWLQQAAQQGSLFPSWNPTEGLGVSIAGQPSAALYYPLRCLWWLPWLSVAQKFSLVIVVHLLIAAAGIKRAARKLGCADSIAWLAAISFSLSCPVFFQHTNLIYLCSAAWIGYALAATFDALHATSRRQYIASCVVFGCAASLMLLAGDPQAVANAFIVASIIFSAEMLQRRLPALSAARPPQALTPLPATDAAASQAQSRSANAPAAGKPAAVGEAAKREPLDKQVLWLLGALALVAVLGCVQWLPAWRWASHSGRVSAVVDRDARAMQTSVIHGPSDLAPETPADSAVDSSAEISPAAADANQPAAPATPAVDAVLRASRPVVQHRYDFSLSPWHALTCLWPTLGGHYLPSNSRLFVLLSAEGRMWIPALYFGCWPCLLWLTAMLRRRQPLERTLKVVVLVAVLAALGNYSLVWLLRELLSGVGLSTLATYLPKDHVGSLTWLLNSLVPGYSMFRYPAKWTVWIVAAASLLAARQLASHPTGALILPRRLQLSVLVLSLSGLTLSGCLAIASGLGYSFDPWLAANAADRWLGPPHTRAIATSLTIAFAVPSAVLGMQAIKRWATVKHPKPHAGSLVHGTTSIALITLAEMTLCASCWIHFLPPPPGLDRGAALGTADEGLRGELHMPFVWSNRGQADLQSDHFVRSPESYAEDQASYQQVWLLGKLGLLAEVRCLHAALSVDPRELVQLRAWLSRRDRLLPQQPEVDRVLRELGVTHRLVRNQPANDPQALRQSAPPISFTWQAVADASPLCQVLVAGATPTATNSNSPADWRWISPDRLVVQLPDMRADETGRGQARALLVRQTNDGGWLARDASGRQLEIRRQPLFVEVELSHARGKISLSRKWFW